MGGLVEAELTSLPTDEDVEAGVVRMRKEEEIRAVFSQRILLERCTTDAISARLPDDDALSGMTTKCMRHSNGHEGGWLGRRRRPIGVHRHHGPLDHHVGGIEKVADRLVVRRGGDDAMGGGGGSRTDQPRADAQEAREYP